MKISISITILCFICLPIFGRTVEDYTFVKATADKHGILSAEFYDQAPFEIDSLNSYLPDRIRNRNPSDIIELHGGILWEGPLRVVYTIEIEGDQISSFTIKFTGLPKPTKLIDPEYPSKALSSGIEGYVIINVSIDQTGTVEDLKVTDSKPRGYFFERSVLRAYRKWEFEMPKVDGKSIPVQVSHRVEFRLIP
ncbi:TonB family C-terminal domain protein [Verrucomicrobiia bacterium DG1235]|nr:TonB family C-terminal domain protein [Verrucomicrobiae bacterium DG1235]